MFFKYILMLLTLFTLEAKDGYPDNPYQEKAILKNPIQEKYLNQKPRKTINVSVTGVGVAPPFATSRAQSYILAKRAATAEAYRLLAEKINGVNIEGKDTIENMSVKSTEVKSKVSGMIRNANIVNTTFKNGLCEVEMEVNLDPTRF